MMSAGPTRRELMLGGLGAAAALSAAAPALAQADSVEVAGSKLPPKAQDGAILQKLLAAERLLIFAYEHALGTGFLKHDARQLALRQLAHEQAHVARLKSHLRALGLSRSALQAAAPAPITKDDLAELLSIVKDERTALQVVVQIENLGQSAYFTAAGTFHDPKLVRLAAEVLACEAQHWTLLVDLLHRGDATQAVPHPTVRGSQHIGTPHTTPH